MKLLKLIGFENLILLAFTLLVFRYGFLEQQPGLPLALNHWQYALFVSAALLIAAAGSIIEHVTNDKYSATLSENKGYNIYIALNAVALGIGYYLSNFIGKTEFMAAFVITASMLYFSITNFRQTLVVGNVLTALAAGLSILMIGVYNFYPFLILETKQYFTTMFMLLLDYAVFGFLLVLIYTFVNDLRNTDTDYNSGKNTLPIALGKDRTNKVVFALAIIPVGLLLYYTQAYLVNLVWALGYILAFVLGPLIYFLIKIWSAKTSSEYGHLAVVLKVVMVFAVLSVIVINLNIANNA